MYYYKPWILLLSMENGDLYIVYDQEVISSEITYINTLLFSMI